MAEAPELHKIFSDNVICCQNILVKYKSLFPDFTDHTSLHSLEVIAFCNELIGENIQKLNCDEIFSLLMAAYLHDSGMGITEKDFREFLPKIPMAKKYGEEHQEAQIDELVRKFHNEFSGKFIEKHSTLFDFPSEKHLWAVIQISRGHRKADLFDEREYPSDLMLDNGNVIRLPYLAALIRLADELDIAADRNIQFMYDINDLTTERDIKEHKKHKAIKSVEFSGDSLIATVHCNDKEIKEAIAEQFVKLNLTLKQCADVVKKRTPFDIKQKKITVIEK